MALVVVVAAVVRIGWALYAARSGPEYLVSGDQYSYWLLGQEIGAGRGYRLPPFTYPTSYYPVGYPALLGLISFVTTHTPLPDSSVLSTAVLQIALGTLSVWLVWVVGRRVAGERVALVAAWIVALFPNLVFSVATFSIEITFTALVLAAVAIVVTHDWGSGAPPTNRRLLAFAVVFAASVLVRPFSFPVLVGLVLAGVAAGLGWRAALRTAVIPLIVTVLALVPWTVRNAVQMDAFVPISTNLGDTLCMDRTMDANGTFRFSVHEGCADPSLPEAERSAANTRKAISFVLHHPLKEVQLWGMRFYRMMSSDRVALEEVEANGAGAFLGARVRSTLGGLADAWFFAVCAAALVGLARAGRRTWRGPERTVTFVTGVSLLLIPLGLWGAPRFHVPLTPFLAILAAVGLTWVWRRPGPGLAPPPGQPPVSRAQAPTGLS